MKTQRGKLRDPVKEKIWRRAIADQAQSDLPTQAYCQRKGLNPRNFRSWCPNCHDEAQFLVELDRKYRDRGLAIVALFFEEPEQQDDLSRVRAFTKKYGVKYTTLVAGAPIEMWTRVPQANNLNNWPTTFFIGKDGLVKGVHAGFTSPGSGVLQTSSRRTSRRKSRRSWPNACARLAEPGRTRSAGPPLRRAAERSRLVCQRPGESR
jgi:thiol-disulfide isomerase/thioredoxin